METTSLGGKCQKGIVCGLTVCGIGLEGRGSLVCWPISTRFGVLL